jgi:hypothetical protein
MLVPRPLQGPHITDDPRLFSFIKQELINNRSTALAGIEQLNRMMLNPLSAPDPQPLSLRLSEPVGRELGLRDGQIVTAVVEERDDTLRLQIQGKTLDLPDNGRWQAGTPRSHPHPDSRYRARRFAARFTSGKLPGGYLLG